MILFAQIKQKQTQEIYRYRERKFHVELYVWLFVDMSLKLLQVYWERKVKKYKVINNKDDVTVVCDNGYNIDDDIQ